MDVSSVRDGAVPVHFEMMVKELFTSTYLSSATIKF
jgi:hypothetical protein